MIAVDHQGNVRTLVASFPDGILEIHGAKIFFADGSPPVLDGAWAAASSYCEGLPGHSGFPPRSLATVYGEDGHFYVACDSIAQDPDVLTTWYVDYYVRDVSLAATGRQYTDVHLRRAAFEGSTMGIYDHEQAVDAASSYGMNTRSRHLLRTSGFFTMSPVAGGGVTLSWTEKPLPAITLISGDYGYWSSENSILRIRLDADSPAETVVTSPTLIGWNVVGGVVVFTSYVTGTSIGTYRVSTPGATPELLQMSDMQVRQIVEL
jgi:hypothetical protein